MNREFCFGSSNSPLMNVVVVIFLLILQGCGIKSDITRTDQTVRVAANLPLTGNLATYGVSIRDGANMAIEDLKKIDLKGPNIVIDWQDNGGEPRTAVSVMQKQFLKPPDIYMSGVHPQTRAVRDQIMAKGTPHLVCEILYIPMRMLMMSS